MRDSSSKVVDLVSTLTRTFDSNSNQSDAQKQASVRFALNVLSSSMRPTLALDRFTITEAVKKQLASKSREDDAIRWVTLAERLSKLTRTNQKLERAIPSVLYVLQSVAQARGVSSGSHSFFRAPASQPTLTQKNDTDASESTHTNSHTHAHTHTHAHAIVTKGTAPTSSDDTRQLRPKASGDGVSDHELLAEAVYACQGIAGSFVSCVWGTQESVCENTNAEVSAKVDKDAVVWKRVLGGPLAPSSKSKKLLSAPIHCLLERLCGIGNDFLFVRAMVELIDDGRNGDNSGNTHTPASTILRGRVAQSLGAAIQRELSDFYQLVAIVETQLPGRYNQTNSVRGADRLTLRRLIVWMEEPGHSLSLLRQVLEKIIARNASGGRLASVVQELEFSGNPQVRALTRRLLEQVSRPIITTIVAWTTEGELRDPFGEFFVQEDSSVASENLWSSRFSLRDDMRPTFITKEFAAVVFRIGKSINFMRVCCNDTSWLADVRPLAAVAREESLTYATMAKLESIIERAATVVNNRVLDLMLKKHRFLDHCLALKRYLLLGRGDFIQSLMDELGPLLGQPASSIYHHDLVRALDTAIDHSDAHNDDAEVLARLDVLMIQGAENVTGRDAFSLNYQVNEPVSLILQPAVMQCYLRLFNFLWRVKRAERTLTALWRKHRSYSKPGNLAEETIRQGLGEEVHFSRIARHEMTLFVDNLQYFISVAIDTAWKALVDDVTRAEDFDGLIGAHNRFLNSVLVGTFLAETESDKSKNLRLVIQRLVGLIMRFESVQNDMHAQASNYAAKVNEREALASERTTKGEWGVTIEDDSLTSDDGDPSSLSSERSQFRLSAHTRTQLHECVSEYRETFTSLLSLLPTHSVVSVRALAFKLDFSRYFGDSVC